MRDKVKDKIYSLIIFAMICAGALASVFKGEVDYSNSERRYLNKRPELKVEAIRSGEFMKSFEKYALDQFVGREGFRSIKAVTAKDIFRKKDNNGIYMLDGSLSKLEYPLKENMLEHAAQCIDNIYEKYLAVHNIRPYLMIVPDKNYYMIGKHDTDENDYIAIDYEELYDYMYLRLDYMEPVEVRDILEIKDYYNTDTHWKQECMTDVAQHTLKVLNGEKENEGGELGTGEEKFEQFTATKNFYGVYSSQSALKVRPDELNYLESDILRKCVVTNYDKGYAEPAKLYNMEKANGIDGYEMFLEGATALITIENSTLQERELVIFRDSFGSSLAPLLASQYSKITLIDIRYIHPDLIGDLVQFDNAQVMFEYSTLLLNNSLALKK